MKTWGVLATLTLLSVSAARPAPAALFSHDYAGMVVGIDRDARKLTVTDHRGNVREFVIGEGVAIKGADGAAAKFEDITSFDELVLTYKGKDRVTRIEIRPPRQQEERLDDAAPSGPP